MAHKAQLRLMWYVCHDVSSAQIEQDENLETFQSYRHRYRMDYEAAHSDDPLYYSVDIGRESF